MRHGDGGKTDQRRNEDTPRVERNWDDIDWNARDREREQRDAARDPDGD